MIDLTDWKAFPIKKLFRVEKGTRLTKAHMIDGDINFIGASAINNGVTAHIGNKEHLHPAGTITVNYNGSVGEAFYQTQPFWASDDVNVLYPKFVINKHIALFILPIIKKIGRQYAFIDKWKKEDMENENIYLPVLSDSTPNWAYIENYIKELEKKQLNNIQHISELPCQSHDLFALRKRNNQNVGLFHLYDLFEIDMGTKLDRVKMRTDKPQVNFVGRSNENQGVAAEVNIIKGLKPYKAGSLTLALGGALGSCFIQMKDFYTSQNVIVLIPKKNMSFECKLYISSVILKESQLHYKAFIDELNPHIKKDFTIPLPISEDNNPDWQYMHDYISKLVKKQSNNIKTLSVINQ